MLGELIQWAMLGNSGLEERREVSCMGWVEQRASDAGSQWPLGVPQPNSYFSSTRRNHFLIETSATRLTPIPSNKIDEGSGTACGGLLFVSFLGLFVGTGWVWYTSEPLGRLLKASAESGNDRVVKKTKSPRDARIFMLPPLMIIS